MGQKIVIPPQPPAPSIRIPREGEKIVFQLLCCKTEKHTITFHVGGRIRLHDHANIKAEAVSRTLEKVMVLPACIQWLLDFKEMAIRADAFDPRNLEKVAQIYRYREYVQRKREAKRENEDYDGALWLPPGSPKGGRIMRPSANETKKILKGNFNG